MLGLKFRKSHKISVTMSRNFKRLKIEIEQLSSLGVNLFYKLTK